MTPIRVLVERRVQLDRFIFFFCSDDNARARLIRFIIEPFCVTNQDIVLPAGVHFAEKAPRCLKFDRISCWGYTFLRGGGGHPGCLFAPAQREEDDALVCLPALSVTTWEMYAKADIV